MSKQGRMMRQEKQGLSCSAESEKGRVQRRTWSVPLPSQMISYDLPLGGYPWLNLVLMLALDGSAAGMAGDPL